MSCVSTALARKKIMRHAYILFSISHEYQPAIMITIDNFKNISISFEHSPGVGCPKNWKGLRLPRTNIINRILPRTCAA